MARKITRGAADFSAFFEALTLPTAEIRLCTDEALVAEREQVQRELDTAQTTKPDAEATMADEPTDVAAIQARLDDIDARIDASDATTILEVRAPSEADMAAIQDLRDADRMEEWVVGVVAACLDQDVEQVKALRAHITRGTWNHLWQQCLELVTEGAATLPTRRRGSATSPA